MVLSYYILVFVKGGKKAVEVHAAVWVPDSEAAVCMHCKRTQFTVLSRRVSRENYSICIHSIRLCYTTCKPALESLNH